MFFWKMSSDAFLPVCKEKLQVETGGVGHKVPCLVGAGIAKKQEEDTWLTALMEARSFWP